MKYIEYSDIWFYFYFYTQKCYNFYNLGNIENGKQFPQINNFFRILEVLNLSVEDFSVNSSTSKNTVREALVQDIYLLNDTELEIYSNLIKYISKLTYKKSY